MITKDGLEFAAEPRTPRGDPDLGLTDPEISRKFHDFADPILGPDRAARIETNAAQFDSLDVAGFRALVDDCLMEP